MRKLSKLITLPVMLVIFIHFSTTCFSQVAQSVSPLESFMRNKGVKNLAFLAHALNTYTEGSYSISGNDVTVEVSYRNGSTETIKLHYEPDGDYFDHVRSISGDEYLYSFLAAGTIVNALVSSSTRKTCIERFFRTTFSAMSGEQIAAAVLTSEWWDWKGKSCE